MDQHSGSSTGRTRSRGGRAVWTLIARFPSWARDIYNLFKDEHPRTIRRTINTLHNLITVLEASLANAEAAERQDIYDGITEGLRRDVDLWNDV